MTQHEKRNLKYTFEFPRVSAHSVAEYVSWIERVHPAQLQDLAVWMRERNGPLDEMDGSAVSLIALWNWTMAELRAGLQGVPLSARPSNATFLQYSSEAEDLPARLMIELIGHYVFEVLKKEYPAARWALDPLTKSNFSSYQEPGVLLPDRKFVRVIEMQRGGRGVLRGGPRATRPDWLLYEMERGGWVRPVGEVRGRSVLAPLLELPRVGLDDPVRRVPLATAVGVVDDGSWSMSDVGAVLAIDPDLLIDPDLGDELTRWPPLDEELIARHLTANGWRTVSGDPISASVVRTDGAYLVWGEGQVQFEVNTADGRARFLKLDVIRITDTEWAAVHAGLEDLATRLGGTLGVPGAPPEP
ncbi:MAG: hypothetical protein DI534_08120 [Leifsonia xyli]|nr:MAG: hypothetical protein DI534_08120 [Leifsonia xyli]